MHAQVKVSENAMLLACRKCLFGWIRAACNLAAIHSKIVQIGQKNVCLLKILGCQLGNFHSSRSCTWWFSNEDNNLVDDLSLLVSLCCSCNKLIIYSTDQKKPNRERLTERVL